MYFALLQEGGEGEKKLREFSKFFSDAKAGKIPDFATKHSLAMRYGCEPAAVDKWCERDYGEAILFMRAEAGYEIGYDEIAEQRKKVMQYGTLLDMPQQYWAKFIVNGALDKAALLKAGYDGEGQVDWLEAELLKLGWLSGGEVEPFVRDASRPPYPHPPSERKVAALRIVNDVIVPPSQVQETANLVPVMPPIVMPNEEE